MACCGAKMRMGHVLQAIPNIALDTGIRMPVIAQGVATHELMAAGQVQTMVEQAVDAGHRHFDSIPGEREEEMGNALRNKIGDGTVKLEQLFVSSKLLDTHHSKTRVRECLIMTLKSLGIPQISLYIVRTPCAMKADGTPDDVDLMDTWEAMEDLYTEGLVCAIGVCNFNEEQISRILASCKIRPAVAQIECHPYFVQHDFIEFCRAKEITVVAYGPFGLPYYMFREKRMSRLLDDPVIKELAVEKDKSPAQIVLRYLLQMGLAIVTRGVVPDQQKQNMTFFDMTLSTKDERKLAALNRNERLVTLDWLKSHKEYPFNFDRKKKKGRR